VTGILGGLELVQDSLPGQLQPLETPELIRLKRGQATLGSRAVFRSFRLLCFNGLALPAASHFRRLYAGVYKQDCCRLQQPRIASREKLEYSIHIWKVFSCKAQLRAKDSDSFQRFSSLQDNDLGLLSGSQTCPTELEAWEAWLA